MTRHAVARFLRPESVFFLVSLVALLGLFREKAFNDPGSLWHIRVGEIILDSGFPRTDPFTYTFEGHPWIPQQWGAEVLMALAHRAAGLDGLLLGFAALVAGLFTWVFARMRAAGMHPLLAGVLAGGCLFVGSFHFVARPHMATIALLAWTTGSLVDFDRGRAGPARLAALIPLFVVWTNLHGGVLGGVFTLGMAVAGWGLLFLLGQDSPVRSWRTGWLLLGIVGACALTPLVNPFGLEMIDTWRRIVGSEVLKEAVNEHRPLDLSTTSGRLIAGFGVVYLALLAGTLPRRPRVTWLLPLVWFALTLKGIRQGPLFVATAAVVLPDVWPHTIWQRLLKRYGDTFAADPSPGVGWRAILLPAAAVLSVLGLQLGGVEAPVVGRGWARPEPSTAPRELTPVLREYAGTAGPNARVFNDANLGGYLIYDVPALKIFMDDRFELYGEAWTREYVRATTHPELIEDWADAYGFELAVVATAADPPPMAAYLAGSPRWREVARADTAVVYRRIHP